MAMDKSKELSETKQGTKDQDPAIRPPVDIFEDEKGITLLADMPGVSKERLEIEIDKDTLSIEGEAAIPMAQGMEALYADVQSTRYQRSFSLSSELDGEKANANLKDGVLTLQIPKRAQFQPRKIEVRVE
jgi:HSP20 family molecular chaperone IbpA